MAADFRRPAYGPGGPLGVRPALQPSAIRHLALCARLGGLQQRPPLLGGEHSQQRLLARGTDHRRLQASRPVPHEPKARLLGPVAQHTAVLRLLQARDAAAQWPRASTYGDLLRLRRGPDLLLQRRNKIPHLHLHWNLQGEAVPPVRPTGWSHTHQDHPTTLSKLGEMNINNSLDTWKTKKKSPKKIQKTKSAQMICFFLMWRHELDL